MQAKILILLLHSWIIHFESYSSPSLAYLDARTSYYFSKTEDHHDFLSLIGKGSTKHILE